MRIYGGPHDGAELNTRLPNTFLFTDGKRCYRAPGRGRSLYRVQLIFWSVSEFGRYDLPVRRERALFYVHNAYRQCASCQLLHSTATDFCTLCGNVLESLTAS